MASSVTRHNFSRPGSIIWLLLALLGMGALSSPAPVQSAAPPAKPAVVPRPFDHPNRPPRREVAYYEVMWGVDSLNVKTVESGALIRFTYRVTDPEKASALNDKKSEPALIAPDAHVKLVIPSLEKVGQLRQVSTPEEGRSYWMAFSNPRGSVKKGDRVNIVIGQFHAEGLVVE